MHIPSGAGRAKAWLIAAGACAGLCAATASGFAQDKEFELRLDNQTFQLNAGEAVEVTLPDGTKANAVLTRNDFVTYRNDAFSFVHPSVVSLSRTDLGGGVMQHLMATAVGTIVIVQTYAYSDPTSLKEFMLGEMTRDAVAAGAKVDKSEATRLVDGKELKGLKAIERLNGDTADYEVFAQGDGKRGVLMVTRMDPQYGKQDAPLLAKFWETLKLGK